MLVENIMFSLIRSEICGCSVDEHIKDELTKDIYRELYDISVKHDLSHVVASALSRIGFRGDDEISVGFNKRLKLSLYRDAQREYAIKLAGDLLEQARIPHIFLKGSVLCHLYPQPWMRTSCDIDILIRKSDAELTKKVLCDGKFIRMEDRSAHDYNFISPNKVHIEMHYTLLQDGQLSSSDNVLDSVWDLYITLDEGHEYRYNMTPELFIIYHLAHMGRHLIHGGCGVRPFLDLWLINKYFSIDEEKLNELLEQCNFQKVYTLAMRLSKVWMEECHHSVETELLEKYILSGGVYGTTTNAAKVKAARGVSKFRSFIDLMFLPRKNLQVLYPKLEVYPMLFLYYQVKRWFRIFDKNKRGKIKHLMSKRNAVTADEVDSVGTLLNQLGLEND